MNEVDKLNAVFAELPAAAAAPGIPLPPISPPPSKVEVSRSRSSCLRCDGSRQVFSRTLKKTVRCPSCGARKQSTRAEMLADLAAVENRRWNMVIQRAVSTELLRARLSGLSSHLVELPPALVTIDRIMQRWAVGHGSGLPWTDEDMERIVEVEKVDDTFTERQNAAPPLSDDVQIEIDRIVGPDPDRRVGPQRALPSGRPANAVLEEDAAFVWQWWCAPISCVTMAHIRGLTIEALYLQWHRVLDLLRARFLATRHDGLVALARAAS